MGTSVRLRQLSSDKLALTNLVFRRRHPVVFDWLGQQWTLRWTSKAQPSVDALRIAASWGDARVVACLDAEWIDGIAQRVAGSVPLAEAPALLALATIEALFAEMAEQVEDETERAVKIEQVGVDVGALDGFEMLCWELHAGDRTVRGEAWFDVHALGFLKTALRRLDRNEEPLDDWLDLPMAARFSVGWTDVPASAIVGMERHDVILLDECWLSNGNELAVAISPTKAFRAELKGTVLLVKEGLRNIMEDSAEYESVRDEQALGDIPVRLTFDLGHRMVPYGDLKTLAPGYVFDLGRELRSAVVISANGMAIGDGELIEIDGRIGVSILNLKRTGSGALGS